MQTIQSNVSGDLPGEQKTKLHLDAYMSRMHVPRQHITESLDRITTWRVASHAPRFEPLVAQLMVERPLVATMDDQSLEDHSGRGGKKVDRESALEELNSCTRRKPEGETKKFESSV